MKVCKARIVGLSTYSQGHVFQSPKLTGETGDAYEQRVWRERMHTNAAGQVLIPGSSVKLTLHGASKYLSESIPGKGKATYSKHFDAGLLVLQDFVVLDGTDAPVLAKDVPFEKLYVPSDGKRGGSTRVWKYFPAIASGWSAWLEFYVVDPILMDHPEVVKRYLVAAGQFVGLGRWRPANGGMNGRFQVSDWRVEKVPADEG